jgi:hypothetical protein
MSAIRIGPDLIVPEPIPSIFRYHFRVAAKLKNARLHPGVVTFTSVKIHERPDLLNRRTKLITKHPNVGTPPLLPKRVLVDLVAREYNVTNKIALGQVLNTRAIPKN